MNTVSDNSFTPRENGLIEGYRLVAKLATEGPGPYPNMLNPFDVDTLWRLVESTTTILDKHDYEGADAEAFRKGVRDGLTYGAVKGELAIAGLLDDEDEGDG
jgi:hypothetical protein